MMTIEKAESVIILKVPKSATRSVGNPIQLRLFCEEAAKPGKLESLKPAQLRFCFDLDGTLFQGAFNTFEDHIFDSKFTEKENLAKDYLSNHSDVDNWVIRPIEANVKVLKQLKTLGHTIIIVTSRKMKSSFGNVGSATAEIAEATIKLLKQYEIPYDELVSEPTSTEYRTLTF
mmetsp:Transcript_3969/g.4580  ORF Transcript_3969/g.4580 Transcript_3969/m.4580 type:complete len:174 (-) Transcript_3969:426-947(-)